MMHKDEWVLPPNEDLAVARPLAESVEGAELFLYPGDRHLFADSSLPGYDERAAALLTGTRAQLSRQPRLTYLHD
jgi:dienelactone hydrolase